MHKSDIQKCYHQIILMYTTHLKDKQKVVSSTAQFGPESVLVSRYLHNGITFNTFSTAHNCYFICRAFLAFFLFFEVSCS